MTSTNLDDLEAEAQRDLEGYNSAFVDANRKGDPSLMRPWMRLPVMVYGNGTVNVLATPEDVDAQYGRAVDALKGTGYSRSILSGFEISVMNPTTAVVSCHAVRERADGSVIQAFDAGYIMVRGEDRWQVAALISRR